MGLQFDPVPDAPSVDFGVFGGSGFSAYLDDVVELSIETPWGAPSAPVSIGTVGGVNVAFVPRHGRHHEIPPHRVNYRANVAVMRRLGVSTLIAPFAAGSLQAMIRPGEFVVVDQLIDRTSGRAETFHDHFGDGPQHVSFADPYDDELRMLLVDVGRGQGLIVHDRGTVAVVNGPRFSTRAESAWFRSMGCDVVNMTQHPEAVLAREAGLRFAGVALVTDYDAGLIGEPEMAPVSQDAVFEMFERNIDSLRGLLTATITRCAALAGDGTTGSPAIRG